MKLNMKTVAAVGGLAVAALGATPAFAAGTTAGSTITNTATVNYSVGGVSQTAIQANNTIMVDRKVSVLVEEVGAATTSVTPGQLGAVTTFRVTNQSNATIDVGLALTQLSGVTAPFAGGSDNFDLTGVKLFIDSGTGGTAGVYDAGVDVELVAGSQYLDQLAADGVKFVYVVGDVPLQANGDIAAVSLMGTAREATTAGSQGGVISANNSSANDTSTNPANVDTVLYDAAGTDDIANDGKSSARDDYKVNAPVLTVAKLSRIIEDPVNTIASGNAANAKAIPGATVEYCITVSNAAGGSAAQNVVITDILPAQTTYVSAFGVQTEGTVASGVCSGATGTGSESAGTVTGNLGAIAPGTTETVYFRVTIN